MFLLYSFRSSKWHPPLLCHNDSCDLMTSAKPLDWFWCSENKRNKWQAVITKSWHFTGKSTPHFKRLDLSVYVLLYPFRSSRWHRPLLCHNDSWDLMTSDKPLDWFWCSENKHFTGKSTPHFKRLHLSMHVLLCPFRFSTWHHPMLCQQLWDMMTSGKKQGVLTVNKVQCKESNITL